MTSRSRRITTRGFPARVGIGDDDKCDGCGGQGTGVSWGAKKPVLCAACIEQAARLVLDFVRITGAEDAAPADKPPVCCAKAVRVDTWAMSGYRQDGDKWTCPKCSRVWEHVCDEASGCGWEPVEETHGQPAPA